MRRLLDYVRTTVIGGVMFLLPLFIVYFVVEKAVELLAPTTHPLIDRLGLGRMFGIPGRILITLASLLLLAFLVGVFARSRPGHAMLRWIEHGIELTLPRFSLLQRVAHSLDKGSPDEMPVVLVATDAGWQIGVLVAPQHLDWHPVFLPGSPELTSGSISYAHRDFIHPVDVSLTELWSIMRSRGDFSAKVCARLAALDAADKLARP